MVSALVTLSAIYCNRNKFWEDIFGFCIFLKPCYLHPVRSSAIHESWRTPQATRESKSKPTKMMFHTSLEPLSLGSMKVKLCLCLVQNHFSFMLHCTLNNFSYNMIHLLKVKVT